VANNLRRLFAEDPAARACWEATQRGLPDFDSILSCYGEPDDLAGEGGRPSPPSHVSPADERFYRTLREATGL